MIEMERIEEVVRRELARLRWLLTKPIGPGMLSEINRELTNAVYREMPVLRPSVRILLHEVALTRDTSVITVQVERVQELSSFHVGL